MAKKEFVPPEKIGEPEVFPVTERAQIRVQKIKTAEGEEKVEIGSFYSTKREPDNWLYSKAFWLPFNEASKIGEAIIAKSKE